MFKLDYDGYGVGNKPLSEDYFDVVNEVVNYFKHHWNLKLTLNLTCFLLSLLGEEWNAAIHRALKTAC